MSSDIFFIVIFTKFITYSIILGTYQGDCTMNNYEKLLNEINEYLNKKEINNEGTSTEIISLYDLLKIVSNELKEFRNILTNSTLSKRLKFASKISPLVNVCSITIDTYNNKACINFHEKYNWCEPFEIYKDRNIYL